MRKKNCLNQRYGQREMSKLMLIVNASSYKEEQAVASTDSAISQISRPMQRRITPATSYQSSLVYLQISMHFFCKYLCEIKLATKLGEAIEKRTILPIRRSLIYAQPERR